MTLGRLGDWAKGYVLVEVSGRNPERLVNLCLIAGFPVWGFSSRDGKVVFCTTLPRYRDIHRLARRAKCVPRIRRRAGLPFIMSRIRRRPLFLLVAALMTALLLYLAGAAWSIQVKGNQTVPLEGILASASRAGLFRGARKSALSTSAVEAALLEDHPQLSWAYVRFRGTLAVIEVVEKARPASLGPGDIVASKDGVVKSLLVLSGIPVIQPGKTVKRGELLIAGVPGDARTGARGSITANTWYEIYKEVPLYSLVPVRTGRKVEIAVLPCRGYEVALPGKSNAFEWYEVEDYPVFPLVNRVFYELMWAVRELSPEDAAKAAERDARKAMERELPSSAKLIDLSCKVEAVQEGIIAVRLLVSAEEEIGVERPWPKAQDGGR